MTAALATEAILRGAGIGDETASALAATLAWLLRDGVGMASRIGFAWLNGANLDANCKQWRLLADFLNDFAFFMDLLSAHFNHLFVGIICTSSIARSIVAVAGGATRTTIVQHQARNNNVADVSAKDGSQETLVNISALICSLILLPLISGHLLIIWLLFIIFTSIHLYANFKAVKSLHFETLNQNLLDILICKLFVEKSRTEEELSIEAVNESEPLIGPLLPLQKRPKINYGCKISKIFEKEYLKLAKILKKEYFIISFNNKNELNIAMRNGSTQQQQLIAAFCAQFVAILKRFPTDEEADRFMEEIQSSGWRTDIHRFVFDQWTYSVKH